MQDTEEKKTNEEVTEDGKENVTEIDVTELRNKISEGLNHKIQIKVSLSILITAIVFALAFFYFGLLAIFKISA
jgi:hypothetical protein